MLRHATEIHDVRHTFRLFTLLNFRSCCFLLYPERRLDRHAIQNNKTSSRISCQQITIKSPKDTAKNYLCCRTMLFSAFIQTSSTIKMSNLPAHHHALSYNPAMYSHPIQLHQSPQRHVQSIRSRNRNITAAAAADRREAIREELILIGTDPWRLALDVGP